MPRPLGVADLSVFARLSRVRALYPLLLSLGLIACGSSNAASAADAGGDGADAGDDASTPYVPPPAHATLEPGVARDVFLVDGVTAPPNPTTMAATPPAMNQLRVVRYRVDVDPPAPVRAVVVCMPGFLGGAGSFDGLARALVRRSGGDASGGVEVWAIDRRANLLEDTFGSDVAESRKDPSWARRYYLDLTPVEGKTFAGFLDTSDVLYESEWGMPVTLGDLRAVIAKVPSAEHRGRVVLLGHSLGATIAEAYAAWDFSGARGFDDLAGLVLVDGVAGNEGAAASTFSQSIYENGDPMSAGPVPSVGVSTIRKSEPYVALPFLGVGVQEQAERMAIATAFEGAATRAPDTDVSNSLAFLLGLDFTTLPTLTNRAAFGLSFDIDSSPVSFAVVSAGAATGGPLGSYKSSLGGTLVHPTDPHGSYDWLDFDAVTPKKHTRLADFADSWYRGPGLNFGEWYFPARLSLDAGYVGDLVMPAGDWRASYGLAATHGKEMDLPVLALAAGLTSDPLPTDGSAPTAHRYDALPKLLPPIGAGRPFAGAARTDPNAWRLMVMPQLTHIDTLAAADEGDGKAWFDAVYAWVGAHTADGKVSLSP
jgi:hypothetical protein